MLKPVDSQRRCVYACAWGKEFWMERSIASDPAIAETWEPSFKQVEHASVAASNLQQALAQLEAEAEPDAIQVAGALWELGQLSYALGEADAARDQLERGLRTLSAADGGGTLRGQLQMSLAWVQRARGDFRAGAAAAHSALAHIRSSVREDDQLAAAALAIAARNHIGLGEIDAAHSC